MQQYLQYFYLPFCQKAPPRVSELSKQSSGELSKQAPFMVDQNFLNFDGINT